MSQPAKEPEFLTRRRFLAALAASVVAASVALPVGFPDEAAIKTIKVTWREIGPMTFKIVFADGAAEQLARAEMPEWFGKSYAAEAA